MWVEYWKGIQQKQMSFSFYNMCHQCNYITKEWSDMNSSNPSFIHANRFKQKYMCLHLINLCEITIKKLIFDRKLQCTNVHISWLGCAPYVYTVFDKTLPDCLMPRRFLCFLLKLGLYMPLKCSCHQNNHVKVGEFGKKNNFTDL